MIDPNNINTVAIHSLLFILIVMFMLALVYFGYLGIKQKLKINKNDDYIIKKLKK